MNDIIKLKEVKNMESEMNSLNDTQFCTLSTDEIESMLQNEESTYQAVICCVNG
jgi:hypothetical protein